MPGCPGAYVGYEKTAFHGKAVWPPKAYLGHFAPAQVGQAVSARVSGTFFSVHRTNKIGYWVLRTPRSVLRTSSLSTNAQLQQIPSWQGFHIYIVLD